MADLHQTDHAADVAHCPARPGQPVHDSDEGHRTGLRDRSGRNHASRADRRDRLETAVHLLSGGGGHVPGPHRTGDDRHALPGKTRRSRLCEERFMNWEVIIKWLPKLAQGATLTLELVAIAVIAGLLLAIPLGIARSSKLWYVRALPYAYIFF